MDPQMPNQMSGYHFEQKVQNEQPPKRKNKTAFIFGLIIVLAILFIFLNNVEIGQEYTNLVKSIVSKANFLKAGVTLNFSSSEESEIDFSEINFDTLIETDSEDVLGQTEIPQEPEMIKKPKTITLEDIEQELNKITQQVNKIGQEINKLKSLVEIQESIRKIAIQANALSQEIEKIDELV